jgi:succinate dehydrogenase / fumarate reductase cytochrome b subunit
MADALSLSAKTAKPLLAPAPVLIKGNRQRGFGPVQSAKEGSGMADAKTRPLSPHMQVWRWGPAMAVSILHRVTGNGLAVVGLAVLLWWLAALAGGDQSYLMFSRHMNEWYGQVLLVGLTWAFFTHMASGIRHFVLDIGAGYELVRNARWSLLTPLIALALTASTWAWIYLR